MRFFFLVLFCFLVLQNTDSQSMRPYDEDMQKEHAEIKGYDPDYRVNYFENIIIKSELTSDLSRLQFISGFSPVSFDLKPAAEYKVGFTADYKFLSIGFSFTPDFLLNTRNLEELNNSEAYDVKLNFFYSDRWRQEMKYSYYKGFFSEGNPEDTVLFANTSIETLEGSTFFILNRNYSYRAHFAQTERQLKSAGSLIPRIRYAYSVLEPNILNSELTRGTKRVRGYDFQAQLGYFYTFVYNQKWLATIGVHPGIGYNISRYNYESSFLRDETFDNLSFLFNSELNLGYNSYRWFFGLAYNYRNYNASNNQQDEISSDTNYFSLYLGYRLNDNKPMRKLFGWFEDTFGF